MRIHAIQTGTLRVKSAHRALYGPPALRFASILLDPTYTEPLPIYAWLIEHPEGLILIDTGESAASDSDCDPTWTILQRWARSIRFDVQPEQEIGAQIRHLGLSPQDVRWVILTHLHSDHPGGLAHFPQAQVLVARHEYESQRRQPIGAIPCRWPTWFNPHLVDYTQGLVWPFETSYTLTRAGDVQLVPTEGHSYGHQSVILRDGDWSYFFAGDASFNQDQLLGQRLAGVVHDPPAARQTLQRIHAYVDLNPTVYLPSHDPAAAHRLVSRQPAIGCGC